MWQLEQNMNTPIFLWLTNDGNNSASLFYESYENDIQWKWKLTIETTNDNFSQNLVVKWGQNTIYLGTGGLLLSVNGQTGIRSTVCSYNWEDDDATVVCKHLGMGNAVICAVICALHCSVIGRITHSRHVTCVVTTIKRSKGPFIVVLDVKQDFKIYRFHLKIRKQILDIG
jgi:hypothetical protein